MEGHNSAPDSQEDGLMDKLRLGDREALEQLYTRYIDRLYSLVFHQVNRNESVAEEITQETFLAALKSIKNFRGQSGIYTWLCSIAYHKINDFYRKQIRHDKHVEQPSTGVTHDIEHISDEDELFLSKIESEEERVIVERAVSSLPMDYRQVLILKYVEDMPVSEISQVMGRSSKSVEGLLARARKALRTKLTTENGEG